MSYVPNKPEQNRDSGFLSELTNPLTGKEHPVPFMDPFARMCLGVQAVGFAIIQF